MPVVAGRETLLTRIGRLRRNLDRAEERAKQVREELAEAIVEAHGKGESPTLIAHVAGYTVQRVHQIVRAARKEQR
jgi:DNA-directed RNA polymerase specialized sigma24 family protein